MLSTKLQLTKLFCLMSYVDWSVQSPARHVTSDSEIIINTIQKYVKGYVRKYNDDYQIHFLEIYL